MDTPTLTPSRYSDQEIERASVISFQNTALARRRSRSQAAGGARGHGPEGRPEAALVPRGPPFGPFLTLSDP
jgi:hypothetical protein